jgi:hypothetical protein
MRRINSKDFSNTSSTISIFEEIIQAHSKEKIMEIWLEYLIQDI